MLVKLGVKLWKEESTKKALNEGKVIPRGEWNILQLIFNHRTLVVIFVYTLIILYWNNAK